MTTNHDNNHWENELVELKALMKTQEFDGYGTMKTRSSHSICEWWYQFVDHYNFDREVVSVALNYFSRYILKQQSSNPLTPEKLQRAAMTSMFLAIKIHAVCEEGLAEARARALSRLAYGHFDAREILAMELDMLQTLDWRLNPPTMHQFAMGYSQLHPIGSRDANLTDYLYEITRYQMELAIFFPELMMNYKPAVLAYAGMLRAEEELDPRLLTTETRERFLSLQPILNMDPSHVEEAKAALENLIPQVPDVAQFETIKVGEPCPALTVRARRDGSVSPTAAADV